MVYWRTFGAWKKKNKSADVIWRGFDVIRVCPLIDHGQQPMKMHTEVTLLYKLWYMYQELIVNSTSKPFGKLFASSSSIKFADKINSFKLINFKIPASIWLT